MISLIVYAVFLTYVNGMYKYTPNNFHYLPPVIKNIIIINVLFLTAGQFLPNFHNWIIDTFALHNIHSDLFKIWQIITHMFMHGNMLYDESSFLHLFFNMFALWVFGSRLEEIWGSKRFLFFYLICGVGAAILHLLVLNYEYTAFVKNAADFIQNQDWAYFNKFAKQNFGANYGGDETLRQLIFNWSDDPSNTLYLNQANTFVQLKKNLMLLEHSVGASGAVFGILFAFGYLFPNTLLYLYFMIPVKAKYLVAILAAYELFSGMRHSAGDNIAHFAHLGGMIVAFFILRFIFQKNRNHFY